MLSLPRFSADETRLVGGFGEGWLGGWWTHADDDPFEDPARGGLITFGFLFDHRLPGHQVKRHRLQMNLTNGWRPDDQEAVFWLGATDIAPCGAGICMRLPGNVTVEIEGPLRSTILLPTPHPAGRRLLGSVAGVKRRRARP
jgi:hypothetical protein